MTNIDKLKPCPFCGKSAHIRRSSHWSGGFQIACGTGCIRTKKYYNEDEVIATWNKRSKQ